MLIWYKRSTSIFETHFWAIPSKFAFFFPCKKNKSNNNKKTSNLAKAS